MYKQRDKLVRNETGIHNERQLANFMEKQQSIRDEFDNVQWRAFLIEDYSDTESVFVYKVHHCVADGISSILMCANLTDKPDVKTFPYMALRFAFWQRALINLTVPLMIGFISVQQLFCWRYERNGIKSARIEGSMSGLKSFALAKDIPLDYVKAKCGDLGVTLNEFIFGIISQTMKQCLEFHDDRETKSIRLAMPFSLRPTPKHELDFRPCNDFAILPV